jgi:hypothetical protein
VTTESPIQSRIVSQQSLTKIRRSLRELRIFIRDCLNKLYGEKKYMMFFRPVNGEQYPEYYKAVKNPIDLQRVVKKTDKRRYLSLQMFLDDVDTIVQNAVEYNNLCGNDPTRPSRVRCLAYLCLYVPRREQCKIL